MAGPEAREEGRHFASANKPLALEEGGVAAEAAQSRGGESGPDGGRGEEARSGGLLRRRPAEGKCAPNLARHESKPGRTLLRHCGPQRACGGRRELQAEPAKSAASDGDARDHVQVAQPEGRAHGGTREVARCPPQRQQQLRVVIARVARRRRLAGGDERGVRLSQPPLGVEHQLQHVLHRAPGWPRAERPQRDASEVHAEPCRLLEQSGAVRSNLGAQALYAAARAGRDAVAILGGGDDGIDALHSEAPRVERRLRRRLALRTSRTRLGDGSVLADSAHLDGLGSVPRCRSLPARRCSRRLSLRLGRRRLYARPARTESCL
mmetsp:Transcript_8199/g.26415  ORF Transcript_8199/g.26415 Transcript_8199/m.26415 type:complete len:322 (-) Transcript_8199:1042-2007(-)